MSTLPLVPCSPFLSLISAAGEYQGLTVRDRHGVIESALVSARRGMRHALAQRVAERFSIELPLGPYRAGAGEWSFLGIGPETWLVLAEPPIGRLVESLEDELWGAATVVDQNDGYAILRLSGASVRTVLAKLVPIDIDECAFPMGRVATTTVAHMAVTLWRCDEEAQGIPAFEICVSRSFARSLWDALEHAAAELIVIPTTISAGRSQLA